MQEPHVLYNSMFEANERNSRSDIFASHAINFARGFTSVLHLHPNDCPNDCGAILKIMSACNQESTAILNASIGFDT